MHFIDPFPIYSNPEVLIEKDFAKHGNVLLSLARFPPIIHDDILPIVRIIVPPNVKLVFPIIFFSSFSYRRVLFFFFLISAIAYSIRSKASLEFWKHAKLKRSCATIPLCREGRDATRQTQTQNNLGYTAIKAAKQPRNNT